MPGEGEQFVELDYLIYAPAPYKGYSIRAATQDAVESAFMAAHNDILCPFDEQMFTNRQVETRVVTQTSAKGQVYLSRIYKGQRLDDLGRDGIVSTIVSIPGQMLDKDGGLALKDVEAALVEAQKDKVPLGRIPKLKITLASSRAPDPDVAAMGYSVPQESAKRLLAILSEGGDSKAFILFKSGSSDRNALCISIGKFLHIAGVDSFIVTSDCPMDTFLGFHSNVVISDYLPKLRPNAGWKIVNLGNVKKSGGIGTKNVNDALTGVYGLG